MDFLNKLWESKTLADIITGLYTSGIFLMVLTLLKPRIKICDRIAFQYIRTNPADKKYHYSFKIVNKSLLFKVYDLQVRAWTSRVEPSTNADDVSQAKIELVKDNTWVVDRLYFGHLFQDFLVGDKRLEKRTNYAAQFSSYDDIKGMITGGAYITLEIIAKHSLTGFTRVMSKKYKHTGDIIKGTYYSGNSCKIKV